MEESGADLVLIVEDTDEIRSLLKELLEKEGYEVVTAENGEVGLKMIKSVARPCLILLDVMMPIMNGPEFLHALEKSPLHHLLATIPVVITSAGTFPSDLEPELTQGFLKKPLNIEVLLQTVARYCRKKSHNDSFVRGERR